MARFLASKGFDPTPILDQETKRREEQLKLAEAHLKLKTGQHAFASQLLGSVQNQADYDLYRQQLAQGGIDTSKMDPVFTPELKAKYQQSGLSVEQQLEQARKKIDDQYKANEESRKAAEEKRKGALAGPALTKAQADALKVSQEVTGAQPISPKDQAELQIQRDRVAKENSVAQLAALANDPSSPPERRKMAQGALKSLQEQARAAASINQTTLGPEAIQMLAENVRAGGQMPNLGRNAGAAISTVMNTAAKDGAPDLASAKASYRADSGSLAKLQANADQVKAFEGTALRNLDAFLGTAQKVIDSGSPIINMPLRVVSDKLAGSENTTAFNVARQVAVSEIAKVLANPGLSGQLSDSARHEVQGLIGPNATLKQIYSAANILKQDMANRRAELDNGITQIKGRIGHGAAGAPNADPLGIR
jgi:hypothetical protein